MPDLESDYVVVGGGLSGCAIASRLRLSANKPEVILLEAGPHTDNPAASGFLSGLSLLGSDLDYAYQSQPVSNTHDRPHTLNAGKCLGGSSVLNYGGWLHADAADYDEWAETVGDPRWSYEGLKPWLRKAEEKTHVVSIGAAEEGKRQYRLRDPVKKAWAELGVAPNLKKEHGAIGGLTEMLENSREGQRQPSHVVYSLDGVKVLTNANVHRVTFSGDKADGVELDDGRKITARKEVIICAGAYHSPQLLQVRSLSDAIHFASYPFVQNIVVQCNWGRWYQLTCRTGCSLGLVQLLSSRSTTSPSCTARSTWVRTCMTILLYTSPSGCEMPPRAMPWGTRPGDRTQR